MNPLFYILMLAWLSVLYMNVPAFPDNTITLSLTFACVIVICIFIQRKEPFKAILSNKLKHSTLFIFGFLIVHLQAHIDYLLGNIRSDNFFIWVNRDVVLRALVLSVIGLISFLLGYTTLPRKWMPREYPATRKLVNTVFLDVSAAILLLTYFYVANPLYFLGNYGIVDMGAAAAYIVVVFEAAMMAIIIQRSLNLSQKGLALSLPKYIKSLGLLPCLLLLVYLLSVILSGDRGPVIYFSITLFGSYLFVSKRKFKWKFAFIYVAIGAFLITLLGQARALDSSLSFYDRIGASVKSREENRFGFDSFSPQTQELETSIRTLHFAMDYVPEKENYMYGRFQIQQVTSIIPFSSLLNDVLYDNNEFKYGGSSNYITWLDQGNYVYSGLGTTVLADFYLDFGLLGVLVGMLFVGFTLRYCELVLFETRWPAVFAYTLSLIYLGGAIYLSRSTFLIVLKAVCWTYVFILVNRTLYNLKRK